MEEFANRAERGTIKERVLPLKDSVDLAATIQVGSETGKKIKQGRSIRLQELAEFERGLLKEGQKVGLYEGPDNFLAIAEARMEGASLELELRVLRVFHP